MKVKELIEMLEKFNGDADVKINSCIRDACYGDLEFSIVEVHNSSPYDEVVWLEGE